MYKESLYKILRATFLGQGTKLSPKNITEISILS